MNSDYWQVLAKLRLTPCSGGLNLEIIKQGLMELNCDYTLSLMKKGCATGFNNSRDRIILSQFQMSGSIADTPN